MRKKVLSAALIAAVMALVGIQTTSVAAQGPQLWSVFVHLRYADGTSYDIPLRRGVPMSEVTPLLQDCGSSHYSGSVVRYYCYPVRD